MKLYGAILSPFVRKVAVVINAKGLECERVDAMPGSLPREVSPLGKIPAFSDGDLNIADSSVICEYLDEQYPEVKMRPDSPADRARARWLEEFADSKLAELCGGGIFFERMLKKMITGQEPDEAKVQNTIDNLLPPQLDYLESQLPAEGFLFGSFGIVDVSVVTSLINAAHAGYQVDAARWPRLLAFIARVSAHPAMQQQLQAEGSLMARMFGAK